MNILVYGAGVLGSVYAGHLSIAGHRVTVLARGQRLSQLRSRGIQLAAAGGARATMHVTVPVIEALDPEASYDLVTVLVRNNQLASVLPSLATSRRTPNLLIMTNNAAGPDEVVMALGKERVLLGFPGAGGGWSDGGVIQYSIAPGLFQATTIGELDGRSSARAMAIASALRSSGFPTRIERRMDAWLKTHAVWITPVAAAIIRADGDTRALAKSDANLLLLVEATREGLRALDALDIRPTPRLIEFIFRRIPTAMTLAILRWWFADPRSELYMGRHSRNAPDEMKVVAPQLQALAATARVSTPGMNELFASLEGVRAGSNAS